VDDAMKNLVHLGMAVCHTLSMTAEGDLVGTQVDMASFKSTGATCQHQMGHISRISIAGEQYTIVKRFEFDSVRSTQSVVIEDSFGKRHVFVKGNPEAIKSICIQSTVPHQLEDSVRKAASSALYQLALGFKPFDLEFADLSHITRDITESHLFFGGLINFQNPLRDETAGVVQELSCAKLSTAMITGDSVLTGVHVAQQAGMIASKTAIVVGRTDSKKQIEWIDLSSDEVFKGAESVVELLARGNTALAVSGEVWASLQLADIAVANQLANHIRVFGRCSPSDKICVVSSFVKRGQTVLMCGDGQNDCGALRSANVGIALSMTEASVVAPFTSLTKSLTSVTDVLREGRGNLASSLAAYCYYMIWGQTETMLQAIMVYFAINCSEWNWIFFDGIWSITMAFSLLLAKAAAKLGPRRPSSSLFGTETLASICGILAINFLYLVMALIALWNSEWFPCRKFDIGNMAALLSIGDNYESSVLFIVGGFQFISSAMALNFGYTFRQSWWKNYVFIFFSLLWCVFLLLMTVYPSKFSCIFRVNCSNEVRCLGARKLILQSNHHADF
jgi:magnesium-transporting ATPase (P-type)